jgi:hypothetical protein
VPWASQVGDRLGFHKSAVDWGATQVFAREAESLRAWDLWDFKDRRPLSGTKGGYG